jgi:prepilin-type N-terminal cleavage/methylation domain-containing protein
MVNGGVRALTRTSGTCHPIELRGYTLLEILVVLAIASLLIGITLPQMAKMAERSRIETQRKSLMNAIEGLGYRAFSSGKVLRIQAIANIERGHADDLPFDTPDGWKITTSNAVAYAVNGVCSGGILNVTFPDGLSEQWRLRAPLCQVERIQGD